MIQCDGNAMCHIKNGKLLEIIQFLSSKSLPQMFHFQPIFRSAKELKIELYGENVTENPSILNSNIVWQTR